MDCSPISVTVGAVNFCVDRTIIVSQSVDSENISLLTINFDVTGWQGALLKANIDNILDYFTLVDDRYIMGLECV